MTTVDGDSTSEPTPVLDTDWSLVLDTDTFPHFLDTIIAYLVARVPGKDLLPYRLVCRQFKKQVDRNLFVNVKLEKQRILTQLPEVHYHSFHYAGVVTLNMNSSSNTCLHPLLYRHDLRRQNSWEYRPRMNSPYVIALEGEQVDDLYILKHGTPLTANADLRDALQHIRCLEFSWLMDVDLAKSLGVNAETVQTTQVDLGYRGFQWPESLSPSTLIVTVLCNARSCPFTIRGLKRVALTVLYGKHGFPRLVWNPDALRLYLGEGEHLEDLFVRFDKRDPDLDTGTLEPEEWQGLDTMLERYLHPETRLAISDPPEGWEPPRQAVKPTADDWPWSDAGWTAGREWVCAQEHDMARLK